MNLFYTPDITNNFYTLDETESKHCIRVLRLELGDTIHLIDGKGGFYKAVIVDANPKRCNVEIVEKTENFGFRNFKIHLAVAPTKNNDRFEWFLEKATEIGIDEIIPIQSAHSERKEIKLDRMNKVIVSAMKQSLKAFIPKLTELKTFKAVATSPFDGQKFIAHCIEGEKPHLKDVIQPMIPTLILIGPEGDFSEAEVELALKNGFKAVSLGNSRLRTETAALVACHIANLANS